MVQAEAESGSNPRAVMAPMILAARWRHWKVSLRLSASLEVRETRSAISSEAQCPPQPV